MVNSDSVPDPTDWNKITIGGLQTTGLLQVGPGGMRISSDGRTITTRIDENTKDYSQQNSNNDKPRNELALKADGLKSLQGTMRATGTDNVKSDDGTYKMIHVLQFKPPGRSGNNAQLRLGYKENQIAVMGRDGKSEIVKGANGQTFSANQDHDFKIVLNKNGKDDVLIDGQKVWSGNIGENVHVKLGFETGSRDFLQGAVQGQLSNLDFNM